jgi:hypothetical protein
LKFKKLVKKQSHIIKEIIAIDFIDYGIILIGLSILERYEILIISLDDLYIKNSINLGMKNIPKALKTIPKSNQFFIRYEKALTLY